MSPPSKAREGFTKPAEDSGAVNCVEGIGKATRSAVWPWRECHLRAAWTTFSAPLLMATPTCVGQKKARASSRIAPITDGTSQPGDGAPHPRQAAEPPQRVWGLRPRRPPQGREQPLRRRGHSVGQARGAIQREVPQSTVHTVKGHFNCRRRVWRRRHQSPWRVKATKRGCCCGCFGAQACCQ